MSFFIKSLRRGAKSNHAFLDREGEVSWDKPQDDEPGNWKIAAEDELIPHHKGLHLAPFDKAVYWFLEENYLAETNGDIVYGSDCVVARTARLVEKLEVTEEQWAELGLSWAADIADIPEIFQFDPPICHTANKTLNEYQSKIRSAFNNAAEPDLGIGEVHDIDLAIMALKQYAAHSEEYYYNCESALAAFEAVRAVRGFQNPQNGAATAQHISYLAAKAVDMAVLADISRNRPVRAEIQKWLPNNAKSLMLPNISAKKNIRRKQNNELLKTFGL